MSSHHVVREKQEPALLVLSLTNFSEEYLGQLLEWSPTVIATDASFDEIASTGIKIDWQITNSSFVELQNDVKVISSSSGDYLQDALRILIDKEYGAVNIISDEFQPDVFDLYGNKITMAMFCGNQKLFAVRSGYEKWLPAGEIIRINEQASGLNTSGLKKISETEFVTLKDGLIRLEFNGPRLLISESI